MRIFRECVEEGIALCLKRIGLGVSLFQISGKTDVSQIDPELATRLADRADAIQRECGNCENGGACQIAIVKEILRRRADTPAM